MQSNMAFSSYIGLTITVIICSHCAQMTAAINPIQTSVNCNGSPSGSLVELGRYYYMCVDGMLDPRGCLGEQKQQIPIGSKFRLNDYEMQCNLGTDGYLTVDYSACIIKGVVVKPGETWESENYWLSCSQQGKYVIQEAAGCIVNGRKIHKREKARANGIVHECREQASGIGMIPVGCLFDGDEKEYSIGESHLAADLLHSCTIVEGSIQKKVIGCVSDGKEILDGKLYYSNDMVFRCDVKSVLSSAKQTMENKDSSNNTHKVLVGCLHKEQNGTLTEKILGCRWPEGAAPNRYTLACMKQSETEARIDRVSCFYDEPPAQFELEPNCWRKLSNGKAIGCRKEDHNGVEIVAFDESNLDIVTRNNLQMC